MPELRHNSVTQHSVNVRPKFLALNRKEAEGSLLPGPPVRAAGRMTIGE